MASPDCTPTDRRKLEANDHSRCWADRTREPWTEADLQVLRTRWIPFAREVRDEDGISRELRRTIESCRNAAHRLREREGLASPRPRTPEPVYRGWKEGDGDGD